MTENKKVRLAVNLDGSTAQKFIEIQEALGITNSTDVIRFIINWYHKKVLAVRPHIT